MCGQNKSFVMACNNRYQQIQQKRKISSSLNRIVAKSFLLHKSEGEERNFIKEARNSMRTNQEIIPLENSLVDIATSHRWISNLLNYPFLNLFLPW